MWQSEEDREFQKEAHHFYSSVLWLQPGCEPSESSTPNHAHTHTLKKKRKHTDVKCYVKCSFHSEQFSSIASLCGETGVYCTDMRFKTRTEDVSPRGRLPMNRDVIWYIFVHQTYRRNYCKGYFQIEVIEHSLPILLFYTDSSAICVSLSLSEENMALLTEKWPAHTATCSKWRLEAKHGYKNKPKKKDS